MLTKSELQSYLQCARKLWLERNRPELIPKDEPTLYRRATDGNIVGGKAREQLGRHSLSPEGGEDKTLAAASAMKLLRDNPNKAAAEVPMVHSGLYARADALVPDGKGYVLRETKSSTFPLKKDKTTPDAPEEHHVDDVAIQAWVMEGMGLPKQRAELNLLNNQWRYPGDGHYEGLFRQLDITADVDARKAQVPGWIKQAEAVLDGDMPTVSTGRHCTKPYDCAFIAHCRALDPPGPEHPIELLPDSAGKGLAKKLRDSKGYVSLLEVKPEEFTGTQADLYRRMQRAHRAGQPILEIGSGAELEGLPYPRYYFDFEGIDFPVPRWKGIRPYEHVPFQWSCHIERSPGQFDHAEFLDLSGDDPSLRCIEAMQKAIDPKDGGPLFVYYKTYEEQRLKELALRHPKHSALLQTYIARLVDLHPLVKKYFYDPKMKGSFSIKKVLMAIAPDLDYGELEEVQEGTGAQVAYLYATLDSQTDAARKRDLESKLRVYCRQDTWAMVEVAYHLAKQIRPVRPQGM